MKEFIVGNGACAAATSSLTVIPQSCQLGSCKMEDKLGTPVGGRPSTSPLKVTVVGTGAVGVATAYAILIKVNRTEYFVIPSNQYANSTNFVTSCSAARIY